MTLQTVRHWSPAQQAIFEWIEHPERNTKRNLVVEAKAGTGKTTTIIEGVNRAPDPLALLSAFNKSIATELQRRLTRPGAEAFTLHSIGFQCVKRVWRGVRVDENQNRHWNLARTVVGCADRRGILSLEPGAVQAPFSVVRLMASLNQQVRELTAFPTRDDIMDIMVEYELSPDDQLKMMGWQPERLAELTLQVLETAATVRPPAGIDFADMLFLPVRNNWMVPAYDLVVIDERQDMNPLQVAIAKGVCKPGGRIIAVGDTRQAIYGFRGADTKSLDALQQELDADVLPLNTTYRCGKAIVAVAKELVPEFEAGEENPEGVVRTVGMDQMLEQIGPEDFMLSRINAPMIAVAMSLIRAGKRTRVQGNELGKGLKALAVRLAKEAGSVEDWLDALGRWEMEEVRRAEERDMQRRADFVRDQAETLRVVADGITSVSEVSTRLSQLFDVNPNLPGFIVCSSVHRAKGLEAERVFVLRDTLDLPVPCDCGHRHQGKEACPKGCGCTKYRVNAVAQQEEKNLTYVAVTRAKQELVWVVGEKE
jgi:hypothetical protein